MFGDANPDQRLRDAVSRRHFLATGGHLLGAAALGSLGRSAMASSAPSGLSLTHHTPKAKNVIYLHMVGGPSQVDLWDHKPGMKEWYDKDLPESVRQGQRLTTMTSGQDRFPIAPSKYKFEPCGGSGLMVSDLLPWTRKCVDDLTIVRSMHTEAINHEPAITLMQTGNQVAGRPCLGSWASYGLGSLNDDLPTFVVLVARPSNTEQVQAISGKLWTSGFLPGKHAGVSFRSAGDPILFLNDPPGVSRDVRRQMLDTVRALNEQTHQAIGDPNTATRIQQYELAYRMQASVPDLTNLATESESTFQLYGEAARQSGTFANTALMARRMVERGVRFVQVYHNNWDTHGNVSGRLPDQAKDVDQACYGLIQDLKARGMLDETLVVWGGEFGRTIYSQGGLTIDNYGRDHHPRCFTMWMAGGGMKPGVVYGETDDFSYNIVKDPVHIRDFHATVLHLLGFDHERFVYKHQGLDQKLTGVLPAKVIGALLA
ncbi:MAG: DUF1501 domain-containing protein [Lacipirellulaceae bacterium]